MTGRADDGQQPAARRSAPGMAISTSTMVRDKKLVEPAPTTGRQKRAPSRGMKASGGCGKRRCPTVFPARRDQPRKHVAPQIVRCPEGAHCPGLVLAADDRGLGKRRDGGRENRDGNDRSRSSEPKPAVSGMVRNSLATPVWADGDDGRCGTPSPRYGCGLGGQCADDDGGKPEETGVSKTHDPFPLSAGARGRGVDKVANTSAVRLRRT